MLRPINSTTISTCVAENEPVKFERYNYSDPLMRWPLRGAAFTNEVGEALRPLIGNCANLTWVPALMYIGADIYDKYKNDQTEYSPDSQRCLKQAIFQGSASILLPIIAVKLGQNLFSLFGMMTEEKLTIKTKEHINELAQDFVANGKMRAYRNRDAECVKDFLDIVHNNLDYKTQEEAAYPIKRFYLKTEGFISKSLKINTREKIDTYATRTINNMIKMRKDILSPSESFKQTKVYKNYINALETGQTKNVAVKSSINKYLQNVMLNGNLVKTVGGFLALGFSIKPIDYFVEHIFIEKFIEPTLDKRKRPIKQ